jgi:HSP20 family protein
MNRPRNPFRGFIDTMNEMTRMREHWLTGSEPGSEEQRRSHTNAWVPTTDIFARDNDFLVRLELPGVEMEDVEISLSKDVLIISGERKTDPEVGRDSFFVRERSWGFFRRTITLPEGVDESDIEATLEKGLLEIRIKGGATAAQPRRIRIGGSGV